MFQSARFVALGRSADNNSSNCRATTSRGTTAAHLCRYFLDCDALIGTVPKHGAGVSGYSLAEGSHTAKAAWAAAYPSAAFEVLHIEPADTVAAARASLAAVTPAWGTAPPPLRLKRAYDVAAAAQRQVVFHYQLALPHYRERAFLETAVER